MFTSGVIAAALIGLAAASPAPAPQQLNFAQISAATTVATGPTGIAADQVVSVASDVTVTSVATAAVTSAISKRGINIVADAVAAIDCLLYHKCSSSAVASTTTTSRKSTTTSYWTSMAVSTSTSSSSSCKSSSTSSSVSSSATSSVHSSSSSSSSSTAASSSSSSPSSTAASTYSSSASSTAGSSYASSSSMAVTTTSGTATTYTTTGTTTTSSNTTCPTQIEAGTYCGFINPEDPCAPQPDGYGPKVTPDTVSAFLNYTAFQTDALSAPTEVASSNEGVVYTQVYQDLDGIAQSNSYLGLYTLETYNTTECAAYCDTTDLCTAFNLFIERDPSQNPTANDSTAATVWGYWCPDPSSITNYKCTLYGSSISSSIATNVGQWREQFEVVIVASNGYDATNVTTPSVSIASSSAASTSTSSASSSSASFVSSTSSTLSTVTSSASSSSASSSTASPSSSAAKSSSTSSSTTSSAAAATSTVTASWGSGNNCGAKAVNYGSGWMGSKVFPGPYNPQVCADYAIAQNGANKAAAVLAGKHSFTPCTYMNAVYYNKNGVPYGTYCNLYNTAVDHSYETYSGGYSGKDYFGVAQSWTFQLNVDQSFSTC